MTNDWSMSSAKPLGMRGQMRWPYAATGANGRQVYERRGPLVTSAYSSPGWNRRTSCRSPDGEVCGTPLSFRTSHNYDTTKIGITVPLELTNGTSGVQVDGWAGLDRFNRRASQRCV
jgi:hypothetical protein